MSEETNEQRVEEAPLSDERYVQNRRALAGGRDLLAELVEARHGRELARLDTQAEQERVRALTAELEIAQQNRDQWHSAANEANERIDRLREASENLIHRRQDRRFAEDEFNEALDALCAALAHSEQPDG